MYISVVERVEPYLCAEDYFQVHGVGSRKIENNNFDYGKYIEMYWKCMAKLYQLNFS